MIVFLLCVCVFVYVFVVFVFVFVVFVVCLLCVSGSTNGHFIESSLSVSAQEDYIGCSHEGTLKIWPPRYYIAVSHFDVNMFVATYPE